MQNIPEIPAWQVSYPHQDEVLLLMRLGTLHSSHSLHSFHDVPAAQSQHHLPVGFPLGLAAV